MSHENYLNHPTFGLLFRMCLVEENQELFATLYAQRLFFLVTTSSAGVQFSPISRTDAKLTIEARLRNLRRAGQIKEHEQLNVLYRQTFHQ